MMFSFYVGVACFGLGRDLNINAKYILYIAIVSLVLAPFGVILRVKFLQDLFANGEAVPGQIKNVASWLLPGWVRVKYTYSFQGQAYSGVIEIREALRPQALMPGAGVVLMVDKKNPRRAMIRDLYT
jgi:hypothetical protein